MIFNFYLNNNIYYLIITSIIILIKNVNSVPECIKGQNFCAECNASTQLCQKCLNISYFPDQNGGCSLSKNCKLSNEGICLICNKDFFYLMIINVQKQIFV